MIDLRGAFIPKCTNLENKNKLLVGPWTYKSYFLRPWWVGYVPIELSRLKYVARSESGKMASVIRQAARNEREIHV